MQLWGRPSGVAVKRPRIANECGLAGLAPRHLRRTCARIGYEAGNDRRLTGPFHDAAPRGNLACRLPHTSA